MHIMYRHQQEDELPCHGKKGALNNQNHVTYGSAKRKSCTLAVPEDGELQQMNMLDPKQRVHAFQCRSVPYYERNDDCIHCLSPTSLEHIHFYSDHLA